MDLLQAPDMHTYVYVSGGYSMLIVKSPAFNFCMIPILNETTVRNELTLCSYVLINLKKVLTCMANETNRKRNITFRKF